VTEENAASFDFGEPLTFEARPTGIVRWIYLGLLGLACLVPVEAALGFLILRRTKRGAG
jgi:hypothetical protein